ncbi:calpain family cysteine protease domain-containing protein [Cryptosporidium andersoni]|uniref:Calpain family cysteine protease domain-containing protein n=1 Tax=Cryptosporidium andersoni TaxID=117008 RepID=A0A1J4MVQ0_9CRYT|nr:calpain family cysteine protease domain-containing protein [Cryptosporidium andersoni]
MKYSTKSFLSKFSSDDVSLKYEINKNTNEEFLYSKLEDKVKEDLFYKYLSIFFCNVLNINNFMDQKVIILSSFINDNIFIPPKVITNDIHLKNLFVTSNNKIKSVKLCFSSNNELDNLENYSLVYGDPHGEPILSEMQKRRIYRWKKIPEKEIENYKLFPTCWEQYSSSDIIQGFIGDCSFIVALSSLLEYEKEFKECLISEIIQDINDGLSLKIQEEIFEFCVNYNQHVNFKMYSCKLLFNGLWRDVFIDNWIPIDKQGNPLLSYFRDKSYIGISLLEKAYLKIMGNQYGTVGSNPAVDIFYLTGWIPEMIVITKDNDKYHFFRDLWKKLLVSLKRGECIVSLGTSEFDYKNIGVEKSNRIGSIYEEIAITSGIVSKHAYQVLRMVDIVNPKVSNEVTHLILLRNPWGAIRWKGKYSFSDTESWNKELQNILNYDINEESKRDNGVFWMEWNDILEWFSHIYISWNPGKKFSYFSIFHGTWNGYPHHSILNDDLHLLCFYPQIRISASLDILKNKGNLKITNFKDKHYNNLQKHEKNILILNDTKDKISKKSKSRWYRNWFSPRNKNSSYISRNKMSENSFLTAYHNLYQVEYKLLNLDNFNYFENSKILKTTSNLRNYTQEHGDLWILLNRHINSYEKVDDKPNPLSYIAMHIYYGYERIDCPENKPLIQGVYNNGSVILLKLNIYDIKQQIQDINKNSNNSELNFILVITQYEKKCPFNFTISLFSDIEMRYTFPISRRYQISPYSLNLWNISEYTGRIRKRNQLELFYIVFNQMKSTTITSIYSSNLSNSTKEYIPSYSPIIEFIIILETSEYCKSTMKLLEIDYNTSQSKEIATSNNFEQELKSKSCCRLIRSSCNIGKYVFAMTIEFGKPPNKQIYNNGSYLYKIIVYSSK